MSDSAHPLHRSFGGSESEQAFAALANHEEFIELNRWFDVEPVRYDQEGKLVVLVCTFDPESQGRALESMKDMKDISPYSFVERVDREWGKEPMTDLPHSLSLRHYRERGGREGFQQSEETFQHEAVTYTQQDIDLYRYMRDPEASLPEGDHELHAQELYRVMGWDVNNPPPPKEALRQLDEYFHQVRYELDLEELWEQVEREEPAWANPELPEDRAFPQVPYSDFER